MVDNHLDWQNWFHFLIIELGLLVILIDCIVFLSPKKCVESFFPCRARLRNSLPIECFLLTYDLNEFKSRTEIHPLTVGSF